MLLDVLHKDILLYLHNKCNNSILPLSIINVLTVFFLNHFRSDTHDNSNQILIKF